MAQWNARAAPWTVGLAPPAALLSRPTGWRCLALALGLALALCLAPAAALSGAQAASHLGTRISERDGTFAVEFTYQPNITVRSVHLAGTFNNWSTSQNPMEDQGDGIYRVTLPLEPGEYQYKFVIDGGRVWHEDPNSGEYAPDGFGGRNSVLRVGIGEEFQAPAALGDGQILLAGLWHRQTVDYVNPVSRREVVLDFRTRQGDVEAAYVAFHDGRERRATMQRVAADRFFDYFSVEIEPAAPAFSYYFHVADGTAEAWYGAGGPVQEPGEVEPFHLDLSQAAIFQTPAWVRDAVFYHIFPERFANGDPSNDPPGVVPWGWTPTWFNFMGGDLAGVLQNLDYLEELGVNAIYFNPIFEARSNHKFDHGDYLVVDPHFGTNELFRELLREAHRRGIRIILDVSFNHSGRELFAFADVVENGAASEFVDWYFFHGFPVSKPHEAPNYKAWWGFVSLPEFNHAAPAVREYFRDVNRYWIGEVGIDGWRLDVANEVPHDFWVEMRELVKSLNPDAYLVGEIWGDGSAWLQGDQFDAVMNYVLREHLIDFIVRRSLSVSEFDARLAQLRRRHPRQVNEAMFNLLGSHDTARFLTVAGGDVGRLKAATFFQMTYVGAPVVYYGDEIGMRGDKDPGSRGAFVWERDRWNHDLFDHFRRLIAIRHATPALRSGVFHTVHVDDAARTYAYLRGRPPEVAVVALNAGSVPRDAAIDVSPTGWRSGERVWDAFGEVEYVVQEGRVTVRLPAWSGAILVLLPR